MVKRQSRSKKIYTIILSIVALIVIAAGAMLYAYMTQPAEEPQHAKAAYVEEKPSQEEKEQYAVAPGLPRTLSIPALGLQEARVLEVGLTNEGDMDAPDSIHDVGWYTGSKKPGTGEGAVLMDGHVSGVNDPEGVFYNLKDITVGTEIIVEKGDGSEVKYEVRESESLPIEQVDMAKMMRSIDPEHEGLNLITCGGEYDADRQLFVDRVLVYAVRIE